MRLIGWAWFTLWAFAVMMVGTDAWRDEDSFEDTMVFVFVLIIFLPQEFISVRILFQPTESFVKMETDLARQLSEEEYEFGSTDLERDSQTQYSETPVLQLADQAAVGNKHYEPAGAPSGPAQPLFFNQDDLQ